jgi:hypothetical protein
MGYAVHEDKRVLKLIDNGPDESQIEFRPRYKFASLGTMYRDLIYGHTCPVCKNLIQAYFMTDSPVDLEPYEETRVLSQGDKNGGELLKIIPNLEDNSSGYKTRFFQTREGNSQLIQLKNHLACWKGLAGDRDDLFEPGERCCFYSGVAPRREQDIGRDVSALLNYPYFESRKDKPIVPVEFIQTWLETSTAYRNSGMRLVPAVGKAGPVVLISRTGMKASDTTPIYWLFDAWDAEVEKRELAAKEELEVLV